MWSSIFSAALLLFVARTSAQDSSDSTVVGSNTISGSSIASSLLYPSGPYQSHSGTIILSGTVTYASNTSTSSGSGSTTSSTPTATVLVGSLRSSSGSTDNATSTSTAAQPTNTTPCNGYAEFCNRKFSNVSMVVAHNSPFDIAHNAASNQNLPVLTQLRDGIRGLQFETHMPNTTSGIRLCHTSCTLLDVGTLEAYLTTVAGWLAENRFEVITIMMGNDDRVNPNNYTAPFQNSGILKYVYTPPSNPMTLEEWPTFAEMILSNRRVVVMLDYLANETAIPWLLDQFSYQWQTPFSPTDVSFPCTEQRPPNQARDVSESWLYMTNHNLNIEISIGSASLLVPAYGFLNTTNADLTSVEGSLGLGVQNCTAMWNRPPNFLLVDYYNFGNFNGSVFQVAAEANNVTYNRASCCGSEVAAGVALKRDLGVVAFVAALVAGVLLV